jgi:hypothetical protein
VYIDSKIHTNKLIKSDVKHRNSNPTVGRSYYTLMPQLFIMLRIISSLCEPLVYNQSSDTNISEQVCN